MTERCYEPLPPPSPLELGAWPLPEAPPAGVARVLFWLRGAISRLARALGPVELCVLEHAACVGLLHVLGALVRTGVPEALAAGPLDAAALAQRTGLDADALFRSLRGAAQQGYFRLSPDGRFAHNERSRALLGGRSSRLRELLLYFTSGSNLAAWGKFEHALRTGGSPFELVHGENIWDWFERHPDEREMFAHAMMGLSAADAPVIARLYPFEEVARLCDVGGGRGTVISELLIRHPHLRGVLCDSPRVLESARSLLAARGVLGRVELSPGDFFDAVPAGADAYLLKNILHDWDDARCEQILRSVRVAAGPRGRVLIVEALVERHSRDPLGVFADLQMMVSCSRGRERSRSELEGLLGRSQLRVSRAFAYPTFSLLEALPA